jgi:beta-glucanase (GH16 family)
MTYGKPANWAALALSFALFDCSSGAPPSTSPSDAGARDASSAPDAVAAKRDASANDAPSSDGAKPPPTDAGPDTSLPGWTLTWSDEFEGANGSPPNPTYWAHDVGGQGWGNDELEYYTDGAANTYLEDGNLVIVATTEGASGYSCANDGDPGPCQYTSGRIRTQPGTGTTGFAQTYGRFEARMKLPAGAGLWPAFWMLGTNISTVSWPACGEIDAMENLGQAPSTVYGHLHMPQTGTGNYGPGTAYNLTSGSFADDYHVFAIEWQKGEVDFFVDGAMYDSITESSTPSDATWAFDGHPFFIVLNLAVGSKDSWPGATNASTMFPAKAYVDYVRVYEKE